MICIKNRANIDAFTIRGKTIIIYEDHRYILNVLKYAQEKQIIKSAINVISCDYHSDSYINKAILEKEKINIVKKLNLKDFWNYIEFEHNEDDSDWICSGMEYGFINDIAMMFVEDISSNSIEFNQKYLDKNKKLHHPTLVNFESTKSECESINSIVEGDFVFDIDLDFATKEIGHKKNIALNIDELDELFKKKISWRNNKTVAQFFKELFDKSIFITICKESRFCGGYHFSNSILSYLDRVFFENNLTNNQNYYKQ